MLNRLTIGLNEWKAKKKERKRLDSILKSCGSVCFCPDCKEPLNDAECTALQEEGAFMYTCSSCGTKSVFALHISPCPIYIEDYGTELVKKSVPDGL